MWCDSPSALWFYWVNSEFLHHTDQNFKLVGALQSKTKWTTQLQPKFKSLEKIEVDTGDNKGASAEPYRNNMMREHHLTFYRRKKKIQDEMIGD